MARAYGSSAHLLMKREPAYGQAPTGNYIRMPFNRCNLGSEQGLIDDPVLGQGRDPLAPLQDVINDEGDIVVPIDPRYLGLWRTGVFGDPDTTDSHDGSWDHEFASGGDDLPSYTLEVGMPKVPVFFVRAGVKLNSIALEFTRSGPAAATISAVAQGETRFGTTQGGTPTSLTFSRISQFQGSIKRAGSPVGNLTGGAVTYSNNLEKIETIRDDGLIEGADPTIAALTGRVDVRFADTTLIDLAAGGTPVDLEFAYTLSAQAKLVLTAHEVYLPKPKLAVEGPGGVQMVQTKKKSTPTSAVSPTQARLAWPANGLTVAPRHRDQGRQHHRHHHHDPHAKERSRGAGPRLSGHPHPRHRHRPADVLCYFLCR